MKKFLHENILKKLFQDFLCERNLSWPIALKVLTFKVCFLYQIVLSVKLYNFLHHAGLCACLLVLPTHCPDPCELMLYSINYIFLTHI